MHVIGRGFIWDDLSVGYQFRTAARTITEADLVNFVGVSWMNEELFTNATQRASKAITGSAVPGVLVYAVPEGLLPPTMQATALAFPNAQPTLQAPPATGHTLPAT